MSCLQAYELWGTVRRSQTAQSIVTKELEKALSCGTLSSGGLPSEVCGSEQHKQLKQHEHDAAPGSLCCMEGLSQADEGCA